MPVALNADRLPDNDDGRFFRVLLKRWPQGLWVVAPDGKTLGFHYYKAKPGESYSDGQRRWVSETIAMLRDAAKEAGSLAPREVKTKPDILGGRGHGFGADGAVRLAVSVVGYQNGRRDGPPVVDSIYLTEEQAAAFAPPKGAKIGTEWAIPESVAVRFTPALSPMTDPIFSPTASNVTAQKVTAKVERMAEGSVVVRFSGRWGTAHNRDGDPKFPIRATATGEGVGVFDSKKGEPINMVWVLTGTYQNGPASARPRATAAVIEWTAGP